MDYTINTGLSEDALCPPLPCLKMTENSEETQRIADSIPGAKLRILQGHGHMSYISSKNVFADLIIEEAGKLPAEHAACSA